MGAVVASSANGSGAGVNVTITKPSGTGQGDLLVALLMADNDGTAAGMTAGTSGFTEISSSAATVAVTAGFGKIFTRRAGPAEATNYTFTMPTTSENVGTILRITGAGEISAVPVWSYSAATAATSLVAPSVTLLSSGVLICGFTEEAVSGTTVITAPAGMSGTSFLGPSPFIGEMFAYQVGQARGASGTKTATTNTGTPGLGYFTVSLGVSDAPAPRISPRRRPVAPPRTRPRAATTTPAQVVTAPATVPKPPARRRPVALVRRAHASVPPTTSTALPTQADRRRLALPRRARTETAGPPSDQLLAQPGGGRLRARGFARARPAAVGPVPAQLAVPPLTYPPQPVRARLRSILRRRPLGVGPVPAQQLVLTPAYPPAPVRARVRSILRRRPAAAGPLPAQQLVTAPTYPPSRVSLRARSLFARRPRPATPVPAQATTTASTRLRARGFARARPAAAGPVPVQVVVPVVATAPQPVRSRIRSSFLRKQRPAGTPVPTSTVPLASAWTPPAHVLRRAPGPARRHGVTLPPATDQTPPAEMLRRRPTPPKRAMRTAARAGAPEQNVIVELVRRRLALPIGRRRPIGSPVRGQVTFPPPTPKPNRSRRWPGLLIRRGRPATAVPAQVISTYAVMSSVYGTAVVAATSAATATGMAGAPDGKAAGMSNANPAGGGMAAVPGSGVVMRP